MNSLRRFPRLPTHEVGEVKTPASFYPAIVWNASRGGISIQSYGLAAEVDSGAPVRVHLQLAQECEFSGRIAWIRPSESGEPDEWLAGVALDLHEAPEEQRFVFDGWITALETSGSTLAGV